MSTGRINLMASVILPLTIIGVTVGMFLFFRTEDAGVLFYTNLGYSVWLEVVFFGIMNLLYARSPALSVPFYTVLGTTAWSYVVLGCGWMFLYSLFFPEMFAFRYYVLGIVVVTLIWGAAIVVMMRVDACYKESVDVLDRRQRVLRDYAGEMERLASRYAAVCQEKGIRYRTDSNNRTVLDRLCGKMRGLTPNLLEAEGVVAQLERILTQCRELVEKTGEGSDEKMQQWVEMASEELEWLKSKTRK